MRAYTPGSFTGHAPNAFLLVACASGLTFFSPLIPSRRLFFDAVILVELVRGVHPAYVPDPREANTCIRSWGRVGDQLVAARKWPAPETVQVVAIAA